MYNTLIERKLRWRCRRGMKELDLLTFHYLEHFYPVASLEEQQAFADLMELQDHLIMNYIIGVEQPTDMIITNIIKIMQTILKDFT